jgi:hypothetical protein
LFDDLTGASASAGTLAVGSTTLSTPQIPGHTHTTSVAGAAYSTRDDSIPDASGVTLNSTGGGGSHAHPISGSLSLSGNASTTTTLSVSNMDVKFANVIACTKD